MKRLGLSSREGFTMVELVVIIAIIAILSAILIPAVFNQIQKAKVSRLESELQSLKTAVLQYYADVGSWVKNNDIKYLYQDSGETGWDGPYTEKDLSASTGENPFAGEYILDPNGTGDDKYSIKATKIPDKVVTKVDADIDDGDGSSNGVIQWDGSSNNRNLYYIIEQ